MKTPSCALDLSEEYMLYFRIGSPPSDLGKTSQPKMTVVFFKNDNTLLSSKEGILEEMMDYTIGPKAEVLLNLVQITRSWDFLLKEGREQSPEIDIFRW